MMIRSTVLLAAALALAATASLAQQAPRESEMIQDAPMYTVLDFDAIPAIDEPLFIGAAEADSFLRNEEMVIGVVSGDEAKAYSTWHLDHHEIVNDVVNGTPIAATW